MSWIEGIAAAAGALTNDIATADKTIIDGTNLHGNKSFRGDVRGYSLI